MCTQVITCIHTAGDARKGCRPGPAETPGSPGLPAPQPLPGGPPLAWPRLAPARDHVHFRAGASQCFVHKTGNTVSSGGLFPHLYGGWLGEGPCPSVPLHKEKLRPGGRRDYSGGTEPGPSSGAGPPGQLARPPCACASAGRLDRRKGRRPQPAQPRETMTAASCLLLPSAWRPGGRRKRRGNNKGPRAYCENCTGTARQWRE